MDSREKGKRGERELARRLNGLGFETRRGAWTIEFEKISKEDAGRWPKE